MSASQVGISALIDGAGARGSIARPSRHWGARLVFPLMVCGSAGALLAYSARESFVATTDVWVAPVVGAPQTAETQSVAAPDQGASGAGALIVQAPGWIEPDPYPINVPAMTEGVIQEIMVMEGDRVSVGQSVARLVDEDAQLALQAAEAQRAAQRAAAQKAMAEVQLALANEEEAEYLMNRAREIATSGAGAEGERILAEIRLKSAQQAVIAARALAELELEQAQRQEVAYAGAQLTLKRTLIASPFDGVVMSRLVEPGMRISIGGSMPGTAEDKLNGIVLRLYDPAKLQVRVDVPLADFAKLRIGTRAEMVSEALPDRVLHGRVTRILHEASVQRNTVPVKVAIEDPDEVLKPDMLVRVRFYGSGLSSSEQTHRETREASATNCGLRLMIPLSALLRQKGDTALVWSVRHDHGRKGMVVQEEEIKFRPSQTPGYCEVNQGLSVGDRVVTNPASDLRSGSRVRIRGEAPTAEGQRGEGETP